MEETEALLRHKRMRAFFLSLLASAALAQTVQFDAASVKPNLLNDRIVTIDPSSGGRFAARGYTLKLLIQHAYSVKGFQVIGGPDWLDVDRYDIQARGKSNATQEELKFMLRLLLAERFGLRIHKEQREMPGFELAVAGGNPKLKPSAAKEENTSMRRDAEGALVAEGMSMPTFAIVLGAYAYKPVVDKTELTGLYDFKIRWTERADQVADAESTGISMISALRDQLGLKLVSKRENADVIVIDSAMKAAGD